MIDPEAFETEVHQLHAFFERWYAGTADAAEIQRLDVLSDSFVMIGPDGRTTDGRLVHTAIEQTYGGRWMQVTIRNVSVRPEFDFGTYEEWQTEGGVTTGRLSTAVMHPAPDHPNGLEWIHLHETWLPETLP